MIEQINGLEINDLDYKYKFNFKGLRFVGCYRNLLARTTLFDWILPIVAIIDLSIVRCQGQFRLWPCVSCHRMADRLRSVTISFAIIARIRLFTICFNTPRRHRITRTLFPFESKGNTSFGNVISCKYKRQDPSYKANLHGLVLSNVSFYSFSAWSFEASYSDVKLLLFTFFIFITGILALIGDNHFW